MQSIQLMLPDGPDPLLMVALLVSAIALVSSSLIFFRRTSPSLTVPAFPREKLPTHRLPFPRRASPFSPFKYLSDEKENAYFADGVQDEILTGLARVADLKVISPHVGLSEVQGPCRA